MNRGSAFLKVHCPLCFLCIGDLRIFRYLYRMGNWINIHTHRPGKGINILDSCLGETLPCREGKIFHSAGIHPCFIDARSRERLEELEQAAAVGKIVALGEAGLDRNAPASLPVQQALFEAQLQMACRYDLPLVIHVVRAVPELVASCKKCPSFGKGIIHGFNNRREILYDLLRHGFYVSVGAKVLDAHSHASVLLPEIPAERLFLETDNATIPIEEIYQAAALRKQVAVSELQCLIEANFRKLFTRCG